VNRLLQIYSVQTATIILVDGGSDGEGECHNVIPRIEMAVHRYDHVDDAVPITIIQYNQMKTFI
jgi:hypothetical protein